MDEGVAEPLSAEEECRIRPNRLLRLIQGTRFPASSIAQPLSAGEAAQGEAEALEARDRPGLARLHAKWCRRHAEIVKLEEERATLNGMSGKQTQQECVMEERARSECGFSRRAYGRS